MANLPVAKRNAHLTDHNTDLSSGYIRIYTGTRPATADTAITTETLLASLRFSATAFGAPSGGSMTANTITSATAVASGTAGWARLQKSDGTSTVMDITVGTSDFTR